MASFFDASVKSYLSPVAIAAYVLVKKSGSNVVVLDDQANDVAIGITQANAAAGQYVPVRLLNSGGTALLKVSAPVAQNAPVHQLNTGVVDDSGTTALIGTAEEAATAAGDIIEVLLVS